MLNWEYISGLDFGVVWQYREPLIRGSLQTLFFALWAIVVGLLVSSVTATLTQSKSRVIRFIIAAYVEVIRNTPFLVQLFWIHFALPTVTGLNLTVTQSALVTLVVSNVAYVTEVMRAGIESVPKGQSEAAISLALPSWVKWIKIILPQALRITLPALINNTLSVFKMTAVLSVLAVDELMLVTQRLATHTGRPVEFYSGSAIFYVCVGLLFIYLASLVDRRMSSN